MVSGDVGVVCLSCFDCWIGGCTNVDVEKKVVVEWVSCPAEEGLTAGAGIGLIAVYPTVGSGCTVDCTEGVALSLECSIV